MNVTPSAVSHQIRALERFLGVTLFRRLTRRVELTPQGADFQPAIGAALAQIETATRRLVAARVATQTLTLSVTPSFAAEWLIPRLTDFQTRHAALQVRLITDHRVPEFARGDVDLAIVAGRGDWPGLMCHKLSDEDVIPVCAPPPGERGGGRAAPDLRRARLIHVSTQMDRWPNWLAAAGVRRDDPRQGLQLPTTALALEAAAAGGGVALANRLFIEPYLRAGQLVLAAALDLTTGRGYYLVYPPDAAERAPVEAFRRWLLALG